MKKICIVINSRANYARIKSLVYELKKNKKITLQIILGSSAILDIYKLLRFLKSLLKRKK